MTKEMEMRYIPWTIIASALAGLLMLLGTYFLYDTRKLIYDQQCTITNLQANKADRTEVKDIVNRIEIKVDQIYNMHLRKND